MNLKILTFNIWDIPFFFCLRRHKRVHFLGSYLKNLEADIICLQESFDVKHREQILNSIEKYQVMEDYNKTRKTLFVERFDATGGLVTFSKYPIKESQFTPFKRPFNMILPERIGRKGFLKTLIETPLGKVLIVNIHFYNGIGISNQKMRLKQAKQLMGELGKTTPYPVILAGDFNEDSEKGNKDFFKILKEGGFEDAGKNKEKAPTSDSTNPYTNAWFNIGRGPHRYDYVFYRNKTNPKIKSRDYKTIPRNNPPLSDHEAVMAEFELS